MKTLKEFDTVDRWLQFVLGEGIKSEATEKTYLHFLVRYCRFAHKTPDELIAERRLQLKSKDEIEERKHEELLRDWRAKIEKDGLSRGTAITAHNAVKSFYKANYVPLLSKSPKHWKTRVKKVPTREELARIIKVARNTRDKAIIMCLAQTGTSLTDFVDIFTIDKIRAEFNRDVEPVHVHMRRHKTGSEPYDTFLGADAIECLKAYLGEKLPNNKNPVFAEAKRTVQFIVEKVSRRAALSPSPTGQTHVTPHGLRAFFSTSMTLSFTRESSHTKHIALVDYWMGHVLPYGGAYMVPPIESQRELYKAHEEAVSIKL